jgi:hypothetical protein
VLIVWTGGAAKQQGYILLAIGEGEYYYPARFEAALREVFTRFAIDPARIAIAGRCWSGQPAMQYGIANPEIFNRIISMSGGITTRGIDPRDTTTRFLLDQGLLEGGGIWVYGRELQQARHPVTLSMGLRGHEHQTEAYDFVGRWLMESWAPTDPTRRIPEVVADHLPVLTDEALKKMITFWTSFMTEPDSIRATGRRAHLHAVIFPLGQMRVSVWMTNMPSLAAQYPSVAAKLEQAGLTAEEHDAYRTALVSLFFMGWEEPETLAPGDTVFVQNNAFRRTHWNELQDLASAGRLLVTDDSPDQVDHTPQGIWRTP